MRSLALILPICLLALVALLRKDRGQQVALVDDGAVEELIEIPTAEPGVIWISHDWVEVAPRSHRLEAKKAEQRRKTFGLDLVTEDAQCVDPNCRACLIDFVYGREF